MKCMFLDLDLVFRVGDVGFRVFGVIGALRREKNLKVFGVSNSGYDHREVDSFKKLFDGVNLSKTGTIMDNVSEILIAEKIHQKFDYCFLVSNKSEWLVDSLGHGIRFYFADVFFGL